MTLTAELNQKAKAIFIRELGSVDYVQFIQQYEEGFGDYTRYPINGSATKAPAPSMNKRPNPPPPVYSHAQPEQN